MPGAGAVREPSDEAPRHGPRPRPELSRVDAWPGDPRISRSSPRSGSRVGPGPNERGDNVDGGAPARVEFVDPVGGTSRPSPTRAAPDPRTPSGRHRYRRDERVATKKTRGASSGATSSCSSVSSSSRRISWNPVDRSARATSAIRKRVQERV